MSRPQDCGPCMAGDHDRHDPNHGIREWLIGGSYCACMGDCAERARRALGPFVNGRRGVAVAALGQEEPERRAASYLSPHEMFRLDLACKPIVEAFGCPYLVGSVHDRPDFRDVDVRLILADDEYDRLVSSPAVRTMLSVAFTSYLREATGLPIDFGIQRRTEANVAHPNWRNPLGVRSLEEWVGDAAPAAESA